MIQVGEFAFYDTTPPYELRFKDDFTQTIFQVPREMLHRRFAGTQALTATTFTSDRPVQRLACQFIAGLSEVADRLDPDNAIRLCDQAAGPARDGDERARSPAPRCRPRPTARRCSTGSRRMCCAHLQNPDLGPCRDGRRRARHLAALRQQPVRRRGTSFQRFLLAQRTGALHARPRLAARMPIAISARSPSPGVLTTSRISAACFASITASRRATGATAGCRTDGAARDCGAKTTGESATLPAANNLH